MQQVQLLISMYVAYPTQQLQTLIYLLALTRALHGTKTFVEIIKKFCTKHIRC